jgi:hypothetical protein
MIGRPGRAGQHSMRVFTVDVFRSHLKQVVSIHRAQFQKLLFEENSEVGPELAELFQDAGKTYLQIAERISSRCDARQAAED